MTNPRNTPAPSVRVDEDTSNRSWVPWLVGLLLAALLAVVLLFVFTGDDEVEEDVASAPAVTQEDDAEVDADLDAEAGADLDAGAEVDAEVTGEADAGAEAPADGDAALEGGQDAAATAPLALTLPFAGLAAEVGRDVTVGTVEVVDVPADEVFTIGTEQSELVVYITPQARAAGGPESAANVEPSSTIASIEGTLEPVTDEFLSTAQLTGPEAEAARASGVYLAATSFELAA